MTSRSAPLPAIPPFRRRGAAIRRRRRSTLLLLLKALALSAGLVAAPAAGVWWVVTSPRFAVAEIELRATDRITAEWLRSATAPYRGRNLLLISLAELRSTIEAHPWVERVEVRRQLPDGLHISISERQPMAVLEHAGSLHYVSRKGWLIAPAPGPLGDLFVIRSSGDLPSPPALEMALELARHGEAAAASWNLELAAVTILGQEEFRLDVQGLSFPLLVRGGTALEKLRWLDTLLPEILSRYPHLQAIDLRFDRRIVLQPDLKG